MYLNKEKIENNINTCEKFNRLTSNYVVTVDDSLTVFDVRSGGEYKVPMLFLHVLSGLYLGESMMKKCIDDYDTIIIVLNRLANHYRENDKYWYSEGWPLLDSMRLNNLTTKPLRDDIYDGLGRLTSYITYTSPEDFYDTIIL